MVADEDHQGDECTNDENSGVSSNEDVRRSKRPKAKKPKRFCTTSESDKNQTKKSRGSSSRGRGRGQSNRGRGGRLAVIQGDEVPDKSKTVEVKFFMRQKID